MNSRDLVGYITSDELDQWMWASAKRDAAEVGSTNGDFTTVTNAFYDYTRLHSQLLKDRDFESMDDNEYYVIDPTNGGIYLYHLDS